MSGANASDERVKATSHVGSAISPQVSPELKKISDYKANVRLVGRHVRFAPLADVMLVNQLI